MSWLWRLLPRRLRPENGSGAQAKAAAEWRLRQAQRDWPKVEAAHNELASWLDSALRRR